MQDLFEYAAIIFEEVIIPAGIVILIAGCLICLVLVPIELLARRSCNLYQEVTGKETQYRYLNSCYIKTETGFQRWDEYKIRATASEGLK